MNKVELEAKLESLTDEINFLRSIYEEVCYTINSLALFNPPSGHYLTPLPKKTLLHNLHPLNFLMRIS